MSADLIARLRLDGDAAGATDATKQAKAGLAELGQAGVQASAGVNTANAATAALGRSATETAAATTREAQSLKDVAEAAPAAARGVEAVDHANENAVRSGNQLAGMHQRVGAAQRGQAQEALNLSRQMADVGVSFALGMDPMMILIQQGPQIADVFQGASAQGRSFGEVMRGLLGAVGPFLPVMLAVGVASAAAVALFGDEIAALGDEFKAAELGADAAADALKNMQDNAEDAADLVAHLATETGRSADEANRAADGYDRQSLSAQVLIQNLRELNRVELVKESRDTQKQVEQLQKSLSGGMFDAVTTDSQEKAANARVALLRSLDFGVMGDRTGQNRTASQAIAEARANRAALSDEQNRLLDDYNNSRDMLAGQEAALLSARQRLDAIRKLQDGQDDGVTLLEEVEVSPSKARTKKPKASEEEREAKRRIDAAQQMAVGYNLETRAQQERAAAALEGAAALERLEVRQAGLRVLERQGVESLDQLTGKVREQTAAAIAAAEAAERQAQQTDKVVKVAGATQGMDRAIALEERRALAIAGGSDALVKFNQAERIRADIERVGLTLTADQVAALTQKGLQLERIQAANDNAEFYRQQAEELRLLMLTNEERDLEERKLRIRNELLAEGKAIIEGDVAAQAGEEKRIEDNARVIGRMRDDLRQAFIESGHLGFDDIADYATQQLRKAVYDALLAEPIDVIINAVVGGVSGAGGLSSQLGSLLGSSGLAAALGPAFLGTALGQSLGLGTGSKGLDLGLGLAGGVAGAAFAGTAGAGILGAGIANASVGVLGAAGAGSLGTMLSSAAVLGPIGAIAALALGGLLAGGLLDNGRHPYARADIGVQGGQFVMTGSDAQDKGPLDDVEKIGAAVVESLNAAAVLFKLDLTKFTDPTSVGYVEGDHLGQLSKGFFGGAGGGFSTGAELEGYDSAEALAADVVKATILRAIAAGASDLSAAEIKVVQESDSLEEAANKIALGRSISESISDAMLQLTDPAAFERKKALEAIEASYSALKKQAEELIAAGLASADVLDQLEALKEKQIAKALADAMSEAADELRSAWENEKAAREQAAAELYALADSLAAYAKSLTTGPAAGLSPENAYLALKDEFTTVSKKAEEGDVEAAQQLLTLGPQFLEASKAYNGLSAQYYADLKMVRTAVTAAEKVAREQADIQKQLLEQAKKQVEVLIDIEKGVRTLPEALAKYMAAAAGGKPVEEAFDAAKYGKSNPDVVAEYDLYKGGTSAYQQYYAPGLTLEQYLKAHYDQVGKSEIAAGARQFALGGIFEGQGVVSQPTTFDIGQMGEAGAEAIMPLTRGPYGLGVRASVSSASTDALLAELITHVEALVRQGGAVGSGTLGRLGEILEAHDAQTRSNDRKAAA